jgi:CHAT domain-containing protein
MHAAVITTIAADPDNRYLVTGSEDKTVRVWDVPTGRLLRVITPPAGKGHEGKILVLAISPDGKTIACGGYTGSRKNIEQEGKTYYDVYMYERASGQLLHTLSVPYVVEGLVYSRDGAFLVATSRGAFASTSTDFGSSRIFTTVDYRWARDALIPEAGSAGAFADFDGQGRLLVLQKFGMWNMEIAGKGVHESRQIYGIPTSVSFSPDGSRIAVAFADATVGVYSGQDLSLLYKPDVQGIGPAEVEFTDDMDLAEVNLSTVVWSFDGTFLYYAGGRTCAHGSCFIRKWSDGGRGPYKDLPAARARITQLIALPKGGVAYAAVDPAFGVLDAQDTQTLFLQNGESRATASKGLTASSDAPPHILKRQAMPRPVRPSHQREHPAQAAPPAWSASDVKKLAELHQQVAALSQQRRYGEALPLARRAVDLVKVSVGADDPAMVQPVVDLAHVQHALGEYRRAAGDSVIVMEEYSNARSLYERAVAIQEHRLGIDSPELAELLDDQGALLRAMRKYDEAADVFQRVLALWTRALGPDHPQTAKSINDLAAVRVMKYTGEKRFIDAFAVAQTALEHAERALGPDHPSVGLALANLAELYHSFRATYLKAAADLHERALAIRERSLGPDHWDVVLSLRSLGEVYAAQKDYGNAARVYARALSIAEQVLGPDHPAIATFTQRLAAVHPSPGQYADTERLYQRVLAIREKEGQAYKVAHALENLGNLYRATGQHAKAEPLFTRVLAIREQNLGPDHFLTAEILRSLGTVYRVRGDYTQAQPLYERAAAIHRKDGPDLAAPGALRDFAALAAAQQDYHSALRFLTESLTAEAPMRNLSFRSGTEEQQIEFTASRYVSGSYFFFLSLVLRHFKDDPQAVRQGLECVLRRKGAVFDAQSRARASLGEQSQVAQQTRDELSAVRTALSALLLHKPKAMAEEVYREQLALAFERISTLEHTLEKARASLPLSAARTFSDQAITVDAVAAVLPKGSALLEFVKIPDFDYAREDFDFPTREWSASSRYLAFILNQSGTVTLVDLGPGGQLEAAAERVFTDMRDREARAWRQHLTDLYTHLWAPLAGSLSGVDKVIISPDGSLNLVPFAALIDHDGRFLVERYLVAYVNTARELLAAELPAAPPASDLLLVANPAFDTEASGAPEWSADFRSRDFHQRFNPLGGTQREASDIPPLLAATHGQTILVGTKATEGAVKSVRSPRILHLATHGFFLPDQAFGMDEARYENALVRSGLALAGANGAAQAAEGEDGLLTALEVTGLDLSGTFLVVLSACNTGVGEVKAGEGVVGLRRAFALAGAKNLMMSLWPVGDAITADEMKLFYRNLQTMAPAEALRHAQLDTIRALKARDGHASPQLWAPFILQGGHALSVVAN